MKKISAICQNNENYEWNSPKNEGAEPVLRVQMNIYQINTCRKDLCWMHFGNDPSNQERQEVKE